MLMEYVQVVKRDLLEYIALAETLSDHHTKLHQTHKDLLELVAIKDQTEKIRLLALMDHILDNQTNTQYAQGLTDAYNIVKGNNNG